MAEMCDGLMKWSEIQERWDNAYNRANERLAVFLRHSEDENGGEMIIIKTGKETHQRYKETHEDNSKAVVFHSFFPPRLQEEKILSCFVEMFGSQPSNSKM